MPKFCPIDPDCRCAGDKALCIVHASMSNCVEKALSDLGEVPKHNCNETCKDWDALDPLFGKFLATLEANSGLCLDNPNERERLAHALVFALEKSISEILG